MNNRKRIITFVLAALMATGAMPVQGVSMNVKAAQTVSQTDEEKTVSGQCGKDANWSFDETTGEFTVSGTGDMYSYTTGSTAWQDIKDKIKTVKISDGINAVGSFVFSDCVNLTDVEIADGVVKIWDNAFSGCVNLKNINIPADVRYIAKDAFKDCKLASEYENSVQYIDNWAVGVCDTTVTSVGIRDNTVGIAAHTFEDIKSIKDVSMPDTLKYICEYSFNGCEGLESVKLSENLLVLNSYAFKNCTNLKNIDIPDSTTMIGSQAFYQCTDLSEVSLPWGINMIDESVFEGCSGLTKVIIPDSVLQIMYKAFSGCTSLEEIFVPYNVHTISKDAFEGHTDKFTIHGVDKSYAQSYAEENNIPFAPEDIISGKCGDNAQWKFDSESGTLTVSGTGETYSAKSWEYLIDKIVKVDISEGITSIPSFAFRNCTALTSAEIADSVTSIGSGAFDGCKQLGDIRLPDNISYLGYGAFSRCSNLLKKDDKGFICIGNWIVGYESDVPVSTLTIDESVKGIASGALSYLDGLNEVKISDGVKYINEFAFDSCKDLNLVTIPDSVTDISEFAFVNHSDDLTIKCVKGSYAELYAKNYHISFTEEDSKPQSGQTVSRQCGKDAVWSFDETTGEFTVSGTGDMYSYTTGSTAWQGIKDKIKTVKISDGINAVGSFVFSDCVNLTDVEIADSVVKIWDNAFSGCVNLKNINIPEDVRYIAKDAFKDCKLASEYENSVQYIDNWAVSVDDTTITGVGIRDNTVGIAAHTFEDIKSIKDVSMPDTLKYICEYSFNGCEGLESVKLSENLLVLNSYAFKNCTNLKDITIPESTTLIGTEAFYKCTSLSEVDIPWGIEMIDESVFEGCSGLTKVTIPRTVSVIYGKAFSGCTSLEHIYLPYSVYRISDNAFEGHTDTFTIYGADKSNAQTYATENNINFVIASDVPQQKTYGDLDSNGVVEMNDLTALSLHLMGDKKLSEDKLILADVNDDGNVDLADLATLKQYLMKDKVVLGPQNQ